MQNYSKNIAILKEKLPHGALKEIALLSGTTIYTVSRVFNNKSNNSKVLQGIREYLQSIRQINAEVEAFTQEINTNQAKDHQRHN